MKPVMLHIPGLKRDLGVQNPQIIKRKEKVCIQLFTNYSYVQWEE